MDYAWVSLVLSLPVVKSMQVSLDKSQQVSWCGYSLCGENLPEFWSGKQVPGVFCVLPFWSTTCKKTSAKPSWCKIVLKPFCEMLWAWKNLFKTLCPKQKNLWFGTNIKLHYIPIFFLKTSHCFKQGFGPGIIENWCFSLDTNNRNNTDKQIKRSKFIHESDKGLYINNVITLEGGGMHSNHMVWTCVTTLQEKQRDTQQQTNLWTIWAKKCDCELPI